MGGGGGGRGNTIVKEYAIIFYTGGCGWRSIDDEGKLGELSKCAKVANKQKLHATVLFQERRIIRTIYIASISVVFSLAQSTSTVH